MRVVACEYSGALRDTVASAGRDALSAGLLPTDRDDPHYQGNGLDIISPVWDLMIAHPPCTHLAVPGARLFKDKQKEQAEALALVQ